MSRSGPTDFRGFALPAAIFLLVILTALGAFILNISTSQQLGLALDIRGERAWQAANAGMEWVRYKLASNPSSPSCPANTT
jgi:MSHA biogenesis protein MshP